MNLRDTDLEWLASNFPELSYVPRDRSILGELRFFAAFDRDSGQLKLGDTEEHMAADTFLGDAFKVRMDLGHAEVKAWPKVYEAGGRRFDIAAPAVPIGVEDYPRTLTRCCHSTLNRASTLSYLYNSLMPRSQTRPPVSWRWPASPRQ